jgi:hypothetical protein
VIIVGGSRADRRAGYDGVPVQTEIALLESGQRACQPNEPVAKDARRVRPAALLAGSRARMRTVVKLGGRSLAGPWVDVTTSPPVLPLARDVPAGVVVPALCLESSGPATVRLLGAPSGPADQLTLSAGGVPGRVRVDYLLAEHPRSFWSTSLPALPDRLVAANGSEMAPWLALLGVLVALGGTVALASLGNGMRVRRELAIVALIAFGSGTLWVSLTPFLESTDELAHSAYVQAIGELGHPPRELADAGGVSDELACWATTTRLLQVRFFVDERPPWRAPSQDRCPNRSKKADSAQHQAVQPPAYYAMAAVGYKAAELSGGTLPDRLLMARLVSVLLAAASAIAVFLLVREAFLTSPWPARAAAFALTLQPIITFNMSMVNSDVLVVTVTSWIALVLVRAWRRGPSRARALALGALLVLGLLAKLNFLVVLPVAIAAQVVVWLRRGTSPVGERVRQLLLSFGVAAAGFATYAAVNSVAWDRAVRFQENVHPELSPNAREMVSYVWQTFFPRLPFMQKFWEGRPPVVDGVFVGATSRLGHWNDFGLAAPWPGLLIAFCGALVCLSLVRAFTSVRYRMAAAALALSTAAYLVLVAFSIHGPSVETSSRLQTRYVLPLAPIWGLMIGGAIGALPSRWRPATTGALGAIMVGWSVLAVAAMLGRFYL